MKNEKYTIPASAKTTDSQKGQKRIENNRTATAKIRSTISLSYTLHFKRQILENLTKLFKKFKLIFRTFFILFKQIFIFR